MKNLQEITFECLGLDVTATLLVEEDDATTPGSVEVEQIESVSIRGEELPDDAINYILSHLEQKALEAYYNE